MNKLCGIGRLGRDAETRTTQSGTTVWKANVALDYGWGNNKGTSWVALVAFGKRADGLAKLNLSKGEQLGFDGDLRVRNFDKKDGSKGTAVECAVDNVTLVGKSQSSKQNAQPKDNQMPPSEPQGGGFDDSIPFAPIDLRLY